jgi:ATP-dependent helicase/nuclease subunit B
LMAGETVFQPESPNAMVQLLGPLEATGNQFDAVWISGMTTSNWPPASSPSALVSRRLQEAYRMPDCTPDDTYQFAEQVITGLVASGESVVCSYPLTDDDVDQSVSDLLSNMVIHDEAPHPDPGWYAATLVENTQTPQDRDNVPLVVADEKISGGAATIQRQLNDPISAFIQGRLGARLIYPQAVGIPAPMRGSLIHEALFKLYVDLPTSASIGGWSDEDLTGRIDSAVNYAFARHEKNTDAVLQHLFALERLRVSEILRKFVIVDSNRGDFRISGVEGDLEFISGPIRLPLRFDRMDSYSDGSIAILDYKTGTRKRLIDRSNEVQEIQLFVYACASELAVSALALVNLDSREVVFDGAGRDYSDLDAWPGLLEKANTQIAAACEGIARGDVRVNINQGMKSARPLNLLSRYTELRHNNG